MIVDKVIGNIKLKECGNKNIDTVDVEWYEVNKRILKKDSRAGREIGIRLAEVKKLEDGDILYEDDKDIIAVNIPECEVITIRPLNMMDMGRICYEIGNQHVPIFLTEESIRIPYEKPLMELLDKKGFKPKKEVGKLINGIDVEGHSHHHHHEH